MNRDDWRHANACIRCHSHKLKCRRPPSHTTCLRCAKFRVQCVPRIPKRQGGSSSYPSPATPASTLPGRPSTPESQNGTALDFTAAIHEAASHLVTENYDEKYALNMSSVTDMCSDADMSGWSDQLFAEPPMETSGFNNSFTGDLDISPGFADLDSDADDLTTHNFLPPKGPTMISNTSLMRAPSETIPIATSWVQDLSKTSAQIFCFDAKRNSSPSHIEDATQILSRIEHSFTLATELSDLMKHFHTNVRDAARTGLSSQDGSASTDPSKYHNKSPIPEREWSEILQEQSNSLLLTSSYLRLLSIFSGHLESLERYSNSKSASAVMEVPASVKVKPVSFIDQPIAQRFMIVNMVEFHLRRLRAALQISSKTDRKSDAYEFGEDLHNHGVPGESLGSMNLTRIDAVLPVIHEQQALLLRKVSRMRARLMEARCS